MKKNRWIYLLTIIISVALYLLTNQRLALLLLLLLTGMAVCSAGFLYVGGRKLRLNMQTKSVGVVYQQFPLRFVLEGGAAIPCGCVEVELEYHNLFTGRTERTWMVLPPGSKAVAEYPYLLDSQQCGKIQIRAVQVFCTDVMGLFRKKMPKPADLDVTVYPELQEIQIYQKPKPGLEDTFGNQFDPTRQGQDVTEVFDVRNYKEGDNVKSIHWKLSGKLDRLMIKEFGCPADFHVMVAYYAYMDPEKMTEELQCHQLQNAVAGIVSSISRSMTMLDVAHHVLAVGKNGLNDFDVADSAGYDHMMLGMLSTEVLKEEADLVKYLVPHCQLRKYSRGIYVTCNLQEDILQQMSKNTSMTVIYVREGGATTIVEKEAYTLITLPAEQMREKLKTLEI